MQKNHKGRGKAIPFFNGTSAVLNVRMRDFKIYNMLIYRGLYKIGALGVYHRVFTPIAVIVFILLLYTITSQLNKGK